MFSVTSRIVALPGQREALARVLVEGSANIPGCLSSVTANDPGDDDAFWIKELWESEASYRSALMLPQIKRATNAAMRLMAAVAAPETRMFVRA
jgi:quinol monooxygenase YgiN